MEGKSNQENLGGHLQPTQSPIFEQINAIGSNTDRILPLDVRHLGDIRRNTSTLIVHHLLRWENLLTAGTNFPWNSSTTTKFIQSSSLSSSSVKEKKKKKKKDIYTYKCL